MEEYYFIFYFNFFYILLNYCHLLVSGIYLRLEKILFEPTLVIYNFFLPNFFELDKKYF